jgi:hypothetical protein
MATAKSDCDRELRRLIALFHDEFCRFVDPLEPIDANSFQKVIHRARQELTTLQEELAAVRRIVNAAPGQTTHDAVTHALFTSPRGCSEC